MQYKTTIKNAGGADATGVNLSEPAPTNTTLVPGSIKTSALARVDTFTTPYNTALNTGAATVLTNDYGIPAPTVKSFGPTATPTTVANGTNTAATNNGGTVTMNTNGTFTYTSATNFVGYDRFAYIASNGNAPDNDAVVVIAVGALPAPVADNYTAIGNVYINQNVLTNDNGTGITVTAVNGVPGNVGNTFNTPTGATVTLTAAGALTYSPPPGVEGADVFNYTVNNAFNQAATVNVTVTMTGMVWFIDTSYNGTVKDGRLSTPFRSTKAFQAVNNNTGNNPAVNDNIFIYENALDYDGNISLFNGQKIIGQDANTSLQTITGLTPPTGSAPFPVMNPGNGVFVRLITTVAATNAVTLNSAGVAATNRLIGFRIGNKTGAGISGTNFGTLTVSDLSISGTGQALNLATGTLAATFESLASTSSSSQGILLSGIGGSLTSTNGTTISGATTAGISIATSTANMNFGNTTITSAGDGLFLQNNSAGTRTFGTLNVTTTGAGAGVGIFHVTGGGILVAGVTSVIGQAGTGPAIDIQNATTAITFGATTVSKTGAASGVNITGLTAGNTVTFASLDITTSNGSGLVGTNNAGTVVVTTATGSINATGGPAINITAAATSPINLNFNSISSATSATTGINLSNTTGTLSGTTGTITASVGTGVNISGGTVSMTYGGSIVIQCSFEL